MEPEPRFDRLPPVPPTRTAVGTGGRGDDDVSEWFWQDLTAAAFDLISICRQHVYSGDERTHLLTDRIRIWHTYLDDLASSGYPEERIADVRHMVRMAEFEIPNYG